MLEWFHERCKAGIQVIGKALQSEAVHLHKENGSQLFKASAGWYERYKKRRGLTFTNVTNSRIHLYKYLRWLV